MPDPRRLASFLQRTQRAMQDAVDRGDQAGVDQYENFLDRGNAIGERLLGQQNQQTVSNLPQAPEEVPMLGMSGPTGPDGESGAAGTNTSPLPGKLLVDPKMAGDVNGSKIANDIEQESAPSKFSTPNVRPSQAADYEKWAMAQQGQSPLLQLVSGVPQAPGTSPKPSLGGLRSLIPPAESPSPEMLRATAAFGGSGFAPAAPVQNVDQTALVQGAQALTSPSDAVKDFSSGFLKGISSQLVPPAMQLYNGTATATTPQPATGTSVSDPGTTTGLGFDDDEAAAQNRFNMMQSEKPVTPPGGYVTVNPNFKNPDDEEPKFFTLHRLAQILLTGAPSAVRSFDAEKARYEGRQFAKENQQFQATQKTRDQGWHLKVQEMKSKIESQKAYATLLPRMVREQARAYLDEADLKNKQIDALNRQIPPPDPKDPRLTLLQGEVNAALEEAKRITGQGFAPVTGAK